MIRALTLVALVLSAIPSAAFADLAPALPLTESQFIAPDPVPAAAPAGADVTPFVTLIRDTLAAALLAVFTAAAGWLTAQVSKWTAGRINLEDLTRDLQMEQYSKAAIDKAFAYALTRVGITPEQLGDVQLRSQILQYAVGFLSSQYPEVIKWIDKDKNGVIDFVETFLPKAELAAAPAAPAAAVVRKTRKARTPKPAAPAPVPALPAP